MKDYKVKNKSKAKSKKTYRKDMYAFGGQVQDRLNDYLQIQTNRKNNQPNIIQTPDAALVENDIAKAKAQYAANTNKMVQGTQLLGQAGLQIGGAMMSGALAKDPTAATVGKDKDGKGGVNLGGIAKLAPNLIGGLSFAMGGTVPQQGVPVEAEGGEMVQLPGEATATEIKGPSHEQGGVDMAVPQGTQIFSKRIGKEEGKLDKSYSERKQARDNYIKRLQAQLDKDPTNQTVKKTLSKVMSDAADADKEDIMQMNAKKMQMQYEDNPNAMDLSKTANGIDEALGNSEKQYAALGGTIDPPTKKFQKFRTNYANLDNIYDAIQPEQSKYSMQKGFAQKGLDDAALEEEYAREANMKRFNPVYSVNPNSYESMGEEEPNQRFIPNIMKLGTGPESYYDVGKEEDTKFSWETPKQEPIGDKMIGDGKGLGIPETSTKFDAPVIPIDKEEGKKFGTKGLEMVGNFLNKQNGITFGDALGLKGMYDAMNDPMKNTLANRAGDTVNSNFYKDYGKEGIKVLEDSKRMLMANKDQAIMNAQSQYGTPYGRSGNTQAINQLYQQGLKNQNITNASLNYANQKNAIQSQIANAENQQDQMVMQGEEQANTKNQQDRDNFNKQMARDIETKNYGMQKIGGTFNQIKERNVNLKLIDQLHEDFGINGMTGEIRRKAVESVDKNKEFYGNVSKESGKEIAAGLGTKYKVENNRLYDMNGVELDKNTRLPIGAKPPVVANNTQVVNNTPVNETPFDVNTLLPQFMQNKTTTYTSPFINR